MPSSEKRVRVERGLFSGLRLAELLGVDVAGRRPLGWRDPGAVPDGGRDGKRRPNVDTW